jgi:hypothetical protein
MTTEKVFPRFLGVDSNGDFVWELASGRWTWGDDPHQANRRQRTFTPDRYLEKYGPLTQLEPSGLLGHAPVLVETALGTMAGQELEPGRPEPPFPGPEVSDRKALVSSVLYSMLVNLDGWIQGARENHDALDHRGESVGEECWTRWHPADFRSMINDVAREFGVSEFPRPEVAKEDAVR